MKIKFLLSLDDILTNDLHSAREIGVGGGSGIISHMTQCLEKKLNLKNNTLLSLHHYMKLYFEIIHNIYITHNNFHTYYVWNNYIFAPILKIILEALLVVYLSYLIIGSMVFLIYHELLK